MRRAKTTQEALQEEHQATGPWTRCPELVRIPKAWFLDPLRRSVQTIVRPCTGLTRRKQLTIKVQLPRRCFNEFMAPLENGSVEGLQRDLFGQLVPTSKTASTRKYQYVIKRGSQHDKLFNMGEHEKRGQRKKAARWRRCVGCARLFLSHSGESRGHTASVMAMICGNVIIDYRESATYERMPRLIIRFFVLSMDKEGHIIWPVDFVPRTKAALRKQARTLLGTMLESPKKFPIDASSWKMAFEQATESRLQLRPPKMVRAAQAAPVAAEEGATAPIRTPLRSLNLA